MGSGTRWQRELDELRERVRRGELGPDERAAVELRLGTRTALLGAHDQALLHLSTAHRLFDALGDRRGLGEVATAIGATCGFKGESDRATVFIERALAIADEIGDRDLKARALVRLAEQAHTAGELERARELWARARAHFEEYWDGAELARANAGLALVHAARDQLDAARALAARALDDAEAADDPFAIGRALMASATVEQRAGDRRAARRALRRAMTVFQTEGMRRELAEAYLQLGLCLGDAPPELDDGEPPAHWLARAQELFRELGGLRDLERVREAFRTYGRRATDRVAEVELLELLHEVKRHRVAVQRETHRLADLVTSAIDDAASELDGPAREALADARGRIGAVEQTLSTNLDDMALAEERFLGAVNAVVVERENIRTLLELTRSLARVAEFGQLPTEIARMACQLCNGDRAAVLLASDDQRAPAHGLHAIDPADASAEWQRLLETALAAGAPAQLHQRNPPGGARHSERDLPLGYAITVPLRHGEDLYGCVYVDKHVTGGALTERDLNLLAVFASQAAVVVENRRIQEELRLAAGHAAATLQAIRDGVVSFDAAGRVTSLNDAAARILAVDPASERSLRLDRLPELDFLHACLRRGEEWDSRAVQLASGEYLCSARVIRDGHGAIAGVVATFVHLKRATSLAQSIVGHTARYAFGDIVGSSPALKRRLVLAEAAARTDSSVLITGESGTGKEVVAQAIHNAGPRAAGPFVGINCAAIPRDLLESELFGYESGAFTGARRSGRPGKFELAEGGTILLDEIGDMPLEMQAKLLRVLQERVAQRLGGTREIQLNCRVIATTNRDLNVEVARGLFRQDLYYRLRVIHIDLPPLRDRPEDIPILARHFLQLFSARMGKRVEDLAPVVRDAMLRYPWPGNIRELEHVLEGEVNLASEDATLLTEIPVMLEHGLSVPLPVPVEQSTGEITARMAAPQLRSVSETERDLLVTALRAHRGNIPAVARTLGVSRGTVYNKMRKFELDPDVFR